MLCLIAACALAGCRGGPAPADPPDAGAADGPADRAGAPRVRTAGAVNGVEIRSWTIDPLGAPLGRALAAYEVGLERVGAGDPLPPRAARAWREQGFRLVEIPAGLVDELEASLPHIDAVRRVWLGQPTRWTGLSARALPSDGGALGGRPVPVRASLRLRSWVEPGVRRRPIRVELALTGEPLDGGDAGPIVLRDLLVAHRLEPGVALAIVPASPDEIWRPDPGEAGDTPVPVPVPAPTPDSAVGPDPTPEDQATGGTGLATLDPPGVGGGAPGPPERAGPRAALPPSLGESLLMESGRIRSVPARASREVIVIVPASR